MSFIVYLDGYLDRPLSDVCSGASEALSLSLVPGCFFVGSRSFCLGVQRAYAAVDFGLWAFLKPLVLLTALSFTPLYLQSFRSSLA